MLNELLDVRAIRQDARSLARNPSFSLATVATVAVGVGAVAAAFALTHTVLLAPLPFENSDRLVQIVQILTNPDGATVKVGITREQYENLRHSTSSPFQSVALYGRQSVMLARPDGALRLNAGVVSASLFDVLGVPASLGRTMLATDEEADAEAVTVISHRAWLENFGGDRSAIGAHIRVNEAPYRIIGIMPATFEFPNLASYEGESPDLWLLLSQVALSGKRQTFSLMSNVALLNSAVATEVATAQCAGAIGALPNGMRPPLSLTNPKDEMVRAIRPTVLAFQGGAALLLLLVCANCANLFAVRTLARRSDTALRFALGASRSRVAAGAIREAMIIAAVGGLVGCLLAWALVSVLRQLPVTNVPRLRHLSLGWEVILLAGVIAVALAAGAGVLSMIRAETDLRQPLQSRGEGLWRRPRFGLISLTSILLAGQLALATVLASGAIFLVVSARKMMRIDTGMATERLLMFRLAPPPNRYPGFEARRALADALYARLRELGPNYAVAVGGSLPLQGALTGPPVRFADRDSGAPTVYTVVGPHYFSALGTKILQGREFESSDSSGGQAVALVNASFVRAYFVGENPLGQSIRFIDDVPRRIVGVIADTSLRPLSLKPTPQLFLPMAQAAAVPGALGAIDMAVRAPQGQQDTLTRVRAQVAAIDPQLAVTGATSAEHRLLVLTAPMRLNANAAAALALCALVIAAVGVFGVLSFSIGQRSRELAVRVAVGADRRAVYRLIFSQAFRIGVCGIGLGLAGAWFSASTIRALLFGIETNDPRVLFTVAAIVLASTFAAAAAPAQRAARVDVAGLLRN